MKVKIVLVVNEYLALLNIVEMYPLSSPAAFIVWIFRRKTTVLTKAKKCR